MRQGEKAVESAELDAGEYPRAMTHSRSDDDSSMVSDRINRGRLAPSCPCRLIRARAQTLLCLLELGMSRIRCSAKSAPEVRSSPP